MPTELNTTMLKAVGFWRSTDEREFPNPKHLVNPGSHPETESVASYLRNGHKWQSYPGHSNCRFKCGASDEQMGSADLTDGEWLWPEGLAHYVETHSVALPAEFIETMKDNNWICPEVYVPSDVCVDTAHWIAWARANRNTIWRRLWA